MARAPLKRLNYQHLLYFWSVARAGSLVAACDELALAPPTVSAQLAAFEARLGVKLLERSGRRLVPTAMGKRVFAYADEIFRLGNELANLIAGRSEGLPFRLVVGADDVVPKWVVRRLLGSALDAVPRLQVVCREGTLDYLTSALRSHEVDLVLSDAPVTPRLDSHAYNHRLGACGQSWVASPALAAKLRRGFPRSLDGAPMLLPTADTAIRRAIDQWLDRLRVRPVIVAEIEDDALLRELAAAGTGVAPAPDVMREPMRTGSGLVTLGPLSGVETEFYLISAERELRQPASVAIRRAAAKMFA